jgi:hypothetical protein
MQTIAAEVHQQLKPLTDELLISLCGLDSLSVAVLFAALEDKLKIDPFGQGGLALPLTVGELIRTYEQYYHGSH